MACGSAWAANIIAREDGLREARIFEARLAALDQSLGPFFRGVHACSRMVRCSQTLSFGLRLSVPMPPVARMEGVNASAEDRGAEITLREVRLVLADVLDGGIQQAQVFAENERYADTPVSIPPDDPGQPSNAGKGYSPRLLAGIARSEKQLAADLRRFIAEVATRIDQVVVTDFDRWGVWWVSELEDTSDAVRDLAKYFEAAAHRLETTIGPRGMTFPTSHESGSKGDIAAAAEALSALRFHYEEAIVRLYSCQKTATSMLRDPTRNNADEWNAFREGLSQAREVIRPPALDGDHELWEKLERLVDCSSRDDIPSEAELKSGESPRSNILADTSRHLETGIGWVSLTTPTEQDPCVFEGGCADLGPGETVEPLPPNPAVTDVLVSVSSPGGSQGGREHSRNKDMDGEELLDERSRLQLVGELDSVLRARPLPPTCEKHLPLENQSSLENEESLENGEEEKEEVWPEDGVLESSCLDKSPPSLESPVVQVAVYGETSNQDLVSELRAQLSMAANEEIFSSDGADSDTVDTAKVSRGIQKGNVLLESSNEDLSDFK